MTTVATPPSRQRARDETAGPVIPPAQVRLERWVIAAQLLACYVFLVTVYWWQARSHGSPWLFSDEAEYTQLSRAIAETGEPARRGEPWNVATIYPYVLAPVWWIGDTATAYAAAKLLGALVMTSALFPVYWLARTLVPHWPALFAAVGATAIPALGYSRLLASEVVAYPYVALALLLIARALAAPISRWLPAALLAVVVAPAVRGQLRVLPATFALAGVVALWLSPAAYRLRSRWGPLEWTAAVALGAALLGLAHELAWRNGMSYYLATTLPDRWQNFTVWPLGALVIGTGLFPALATGLVAWRPEDARRSPAYRAFVSILVAAIPAFVLYAGVKAVYLSTVYGDVIVERNLIYLAPLLFVSAALVLARPVVNPLALALGAVLLVFLVRETPYQLDHFPYADAPGLAVLAELNRSLSLDDAAIEQRLLVAVAVLAGIAVALTRLRRAPVAHAGVGAAVAALVVGWNVVGETSFGDGINSLGNRLRTAIPAPPTWVDAAVGDASVLYLGQAVADPNPVLSTEFWNRSVDHVGSLDATAPGPGPTVTPLPYRADGSTLNDPGADYVVTDSAGVDVYGTEIQRTGVWRLIRLDGPLRLRSGVTGLYPDGWSGAAAAYSRYGRGETGTVEITLSRLAWTGPDVPGRVEVRVGRLVPAPVEVIENPCRGEVCVSQQPRIVRPVRTRHWTARSGAQTSFRLRVRTPFRVEVRVTPTFSPRDFGGSDGRQLGVQVGFGFRPARA